MNKLITLLFVTSVIAQAVDLNPPSWRGQPYSTGQQWVYAADDPNPYAAGWNNPFGPMQINLLGDWTVEPIPDADWTMPYEFYTAWRWNYSNGPLLNINVDTNWPGTSTNKRARVQVTWGMNVVNGDGVIYVSNNGLEGIFPSGQLMDSQLLGVTDSIAWYQTTYDLVFAWGDLVYDEFGNVVDIISGELPCWSDLQLYPNNPIRFGSSTSYPIYVADIVVDTICVPEPMTILLLGLGTVALRSFRRF